MAEVARAALEAAAALARTGDRRRAREVCAAVLFDTLPMIAARAELLRAMLYALLLARGFRLLSRVVLAAGGHNVQVILMPECDGPITPPRRRERPGRTTYVVEPRWLDRLSPDDLFLRDWCDRLIAPRHGAADLPATVPAPRHLEPA
jgi:hypothetical protein